MNNCEIGGFHAVTEVHGFHVVTEVQYDRNNYD